MNTLLKISLSLVTLALVTACDRSASPTPADATTTSGPLGTVVLEIKNAQGVQRFEIDDVAQDATLESVMRRADGLEAEISGSGTTAFVHRIGTQSTSGSEGWTYSIDGKWADKGIGTQTLRPPTTVTWEFGEMKTP